MVCIQFWASFSLFVQIFGCCENEENVKYLKSALFNKLVEEQHQLELHEMKKSCWCLRARVCFHVYVCMNICHAKKKRFTGLTTKKRKIKKSNEAPGEKVFNFSLCLFCVLASKYSNRNSNEECLCILRSRRLLYPTAMIGLG